MLRFLNQGSKITEYLDIAGSFFGAFPHSSTSHTELYCIRISALNTREAPFPSQEKKNLNCVMAI